MVLAAATVDSFGLGPWHDAKVMKSLGFKVEGLGFRGRGNDGADEASEGSRFEVTPGAYAEL